MEHKMKQESLEKSQSDLKKLRRKSQGKNANKYENRESEVRWSHTALKEWTHTHTHLQQGSHTVYAHRHTLTPESVSVTVVGNSVCGSCLSLPPCSSKTPSYSLFLFPTLLRPHAHHHTTTHVSNQTHCQEF